MAAIKIDLFGFTTLTEAVNQMKPVPSFIKDLLFKRHHTNSTKTVMTDIRINGEKVAPLVKRGNEALVVGNLGNKATMVEPPQIRLKKYLTPDDLYYTRSAGDQLFIPGTAPGVDPVQAAREAKMALEQQDLVDITARTIELLCCKGLAGSYSVQQDDGLYSVDFAMPTANKPSLTGADKWSASTTCKPLKNMRTWKLVAQKASGKLPSIAVMSPATWEYFFAADEVQNTLNKLKIDVGSITTDPSFISVGVEKKAVLDNVTYYTYGGTYTDSNGVQQQLIPDGNVSLFTPTADFRLEYGAIHDVKAGVVAAEFFSKDWEREDPSGLWLLVESHPMPVFNEPASMIFAQVV